ncbi:hypothetical protein LEP1GSC123_1536 [Leptospira borgpetersenii str. 200701203]|uniref:Uncharacterized protein n=1 Tax=Leptospira borgpetersenii str. 200701203 TaxID=1193007 RepID=M3HHJ1_LEPBO|nr:hypothetical protein LEP1GSC123_1536 [Leptospira borgpetersenii str. 200701203]
MWNTNLENAGRDAERVLERLKDSAEDFFEKQEEKISRLNGTIDAKISKQLTSLMDKGQLQLGQLEERISKYILDVKKIWKNLSRLPAKTATIR